MNRAEPPGALTHNLHRVVLGSRKAPAAPRAAVGSPRQLQNKQCEFCQQLFTGTDAPKCTINVYPLENEPGLREFCISPFIHSHMHIAKMLVSGQGAWGQLLAIFILPGTVNKSCNCSAVQGTYPSWDFFWCTLDFFFFNETTTDISSFPLQGKFFNVNSVIFPCPYLFAYTHEFISMANCNQFVSEMLFWNRAGKSPWFNREYWLFSPYCPGYLPEQRAG